MSDKLCHCGNPLHYSDPKMQAKVEELIESLGEFIEVTVGEQGTWLVPRHYIALHGIQAADVPGLGFERIN